MKNQKVLVVAITLFIMVLFGMVFKVILNNYTGIAIGVIFGLAFYIVAKNMQKNKK